MKNYLTSLGSKTWWLVSSAFALLLGLLFLTNGRRKDAESKLETAELDKKDAVLEDRTNEARKATDAAKSETKTAEELAEFFKKKD